MATRSIRFLSLAAAIVAAPAFSASGVHLPITECESSALLAGVCPAESPGCLWLADNEQDTAVFRIDDPAAASPVVKLVELNREVGDIEALAALPNRRILVMASLGHKSNCSWPSKRQQFAVLNTADGTATLLRWNQPWSCADALSGISSPTAAQFCLVVDNSKTSVDRIAGDASLTNAQKKLACPKIPSLNFEGAASDPQQRVWLGARAPLLPRDTLATAQDAVLLRLGSNGDNPAMRFDSLRRLDLAGLGIRELTASAHWLWIVAGAPLDSTDGFALYRLPWAQLESGEELLHPERVRDLPSSAEGFALVADRAWLAIDGNNDDPSCPTHEHLQSLPWPKN